MTLVEIRKDNDTIRDRIHNCNIIHSFICKSILSTTIYLDSRSDNRLISSCWDTYRFFRKRESNHSEKLNEAYKQLKKLSFVIDERRLRLNKEVDDIPYFSHAISHLKSYKQDYKTWTSVNTLIDEHNELLNEIEPSLRKEIRNQARDNQYYPDYNVVTTKPDIHPKNMNFYNLVAIFEYAFNYLYKHEDEGMLISDFLLYHKKIGDRHKIDNEEQIIIIETDKESDADPEKLKRLLTKICKNDKIRQKFNDLKNKRKEANETVKDFSHRIKTLSENIDLGHIIKGKCNLGY